MGARPVPGAGALAEVGPSARTFTACFCSVADLTPRERSEGVEFRRGYAALRCQVRLRILRRNWLGRRVAGLCMSRDREQEHAQGKRDALRQRDRHAANPQSHDKVAHCRTARGPAVLIVVTRIS